MYFDGFLYMYQALIWYICRSFLNQFLAAKYTNPRLFIKWTFVKKVESQTKIDRKMKWCNPQKICKY